jgi:FtsP/CotA-like multicopper oxidase with cupredoxin domain
MNAKEPPTLSRRTMIAAGAASLAGGSALVNELLAQDARVSSDAPPNARTIPPDAGPMAPGEPGRDYTPCVAPDLPTLPFKVRGGVKVFHLVANTFKHQIAPGLTINAWGYNGVTPGPLIEAVEGDRVRIYVTNRLPAPTSVHWHGVLLPNGMDGIGALTQPSIAPGETFRYEFTLREHGTRMYHPHYDEMTQLAMGMSGMFVIHPRRRDAAEPPPDRDFAIMLNEWKIEPGRATPDVNAMSDFNVLTMNGKSFPGTSPLVVRTGQRVKIRYGNLGPMDHHPIHLHGYHFHVTGTDAGPIPASARHPNTTVLVPVGATRDVEFVADAPGDWALHCHMTHHMMNQMGHGMPGLVGTNLDGFDAKVRPLLPGYMTMGADGMGGHGKHVQHMGVPENSIPMVGADGPFGYIDMGGMFTILKVRDGIAGYADPGWYRHPEGTVARAATADELRRDGVLP